MNIISLVSYPFLPAKSGGQKGIALFYKYFSRHQPVTIVTTKKNDAGFADGYEVLNILSNSRLRYINPFLFFRLRKIISEKKATHLILEHPYYGWLGFLLKTFCNIRLVVHSHNIEGIRWKSLGKWWWKILWNYEKWTHRRADYNFFIQDDDRKYAVQAFDLDDKKCITVFFGTELSAPPEIPKRRFSSAALHGQLNIPETSPLLLFNGAFRYSPNLEALENLLSKVNPRLQENKLFCVILIIGLDIPESILNGTYPGVRVLGFADDLELYLTGCDVFLNPVVSGGGIKTKLVEALAFSLTSVSTTNGATGIDPVICGNKLFICKDGDWNAFADAIVKAVYMKNDTPPDFYNDFSWQNISRKASDFIKTTHKKMVNEIR